MKNYTHHILTSTVLICTIINCLISVVESQQQIKLTTDSANFNLIIPAEQGNTYTTNEQFRFESVMSRLFHTKLSEYASSDVNSRIIATNVNVERMRNPDKAKPWNKKNKDGEEAEEVLYMKYDGDEDETSTTPVVADLTLNSIVSTTSSDVGLHNALMIGEVEEVPSLASVLRKIVSSDDILNALIAEDLIMDDDTPSITEFSFEDFEEGEMRGVTATETEFVQRKGSNGPMGWAIFLLLVAILSGASYVYKQEYGHWPFMKARSGGDCDSVHFEGDIDDDIENATTASGVLGLKGGHPNAIANNENAHPNNMLVRRKSSHRGLSSSSNQGRNVQSLSSPRTQTSGNSSKHPVGILPSKYPVGHFLTPPQKQSSRRLERMTST